jgi:hypothetical protein
LALWKAAVYDSFIRQTVSLPVTPNTLLKLQRIDLLVFRRFFQSKPPPSFSPEERGKELATLIQTLPLAWENVHSLTPSPPWYHLERLTSAIAFFFLASKELSAVLRPSRGQAAAVSRLTSDIPPCLFIYQELVRASDTNPQVHKKIEMQLSVLKTDAEILDYLKRYKSPQGIAVALTHWRLHNEWGANHPGLLEEPPRSVFRRYLYNKGQHKKLDQYIQKANPLYPHHTLIEIWASEYLPS